MALEYAGQFDVKVARIHGVGGDYINIIPNLMMIKIFEDMTLPTIYGELMLYSTTSHADILPIIGQEELELHLITPDFEEIADFNFGASAINHSERFSIYALENRQHHDLTNQTMILKFCSPEMLISSRKTFSRVERGTYSNIVNRIMSQEVGTSKTLHIEETLGDKKMVLSYMHPFDAVAQAATYSTSNENKTTSYVFFENRDGFHFRSLPQIYKEDTQWTYTLLSEGLKQSKGGVDIGADLKSITSLKMYHNNRLANTIDGSLGSTTITHDIFNKQYRTSSYDYFTQFYNEHHIDFPSSMPLYVEDNIIYSGGRLFLRPTSIKNKGSVRLEGAFSSDHISKYDADLQARNAQLKHLQYGYSLTATALGNSIITAGQMIDIDIPQAIESSVEELSESDAFFRGKFLVKQVSHQFDTSNFVHEITMNLVRDSMPQSKLTEALSAAF